MFQLGRLLEDGVTCEHHVMPRSAYDALAPPQFVHLRHPSQHTSFSGQVTPLTMDDRRAQMGGWTSEVCPDWLTKDIGTGCDAFPCDEAVSGPSECVIDGTGHHKCFCKVETCPIQVGATMKCVPEGCAKEMASVAAELERAKGEVASAQTALQMESPDQAVDSMESEMASKLPGQKEDVVLGEHRPVMLSEGQVKQMELQGIDADLLQVPNGGQFTPTDSIEDLLKKLKGTSVGEPTGGAPSVPLSTGVASIVNEANTGGLGKTVKQYSGAVASLIEATQNNLNTDRIALATAEDCSMSESILRQLHLNEA